MLNINIFLVTTYNVLASSKCQINGIQFYSAISLYIVSSVNTLQSTNNHTWYIHEGYANGNGTCTDHIGALYNPYGVSTTAESGYFDDCTSQSQQRCAMGDLSGKLEVLGLEPVTTSPHKTYSFYDELLYLVGPFTGEFRNAVLYIETAIALSVCLNDHALLTSIHTQYLSIGSPWPLPCGVWHWFPKWSTPWLCQH